MKWELEDLLNQIQEERCMRLRWCTFDKKKILLCEVEGTIFVPSKHIKKIEKSGKIYPTY
jgi:hypothetical protein